MERALDLKQFTGWLLEQGDPAKWLRLVDAYEVLYGPMTAAEKARYAKVVEQVWAKERMKYMDMYRHGKERLSTDERSEVLEEFWEMIDKRIEDGELPDA